VRLLVAAVGRLKSGPEAALVADYAARIRALNRRAGVSEFRILEVEAPKSLAGAKRRGRESALLRAAAPEGAARIVLDERGECLTSESLARMLAARRDRGQDAAFLVGGAEGCAEAVKADADLVLAFGRATWPHMLVRAMLVEQIYRAMTILCGHPYHRA
jgi:23S rRNA (pseudouridine1915-N3)-methyltransferase